MYIDESHYMRRAMQVIEGMGPQESKSVYVYPYDHPYFGQLFLASILKLIGYPTIVLNQSSSSPYSAPSSTTTNTSSTTTAGDSNSSNIQHSIEMLYLVPRMVMGILAIVDTFLVYKISERYYNKNRNVAFIASVLFAVMPMTWLLRRILLDSILLPFLLSSILFALYAKDASNNSSSTTNSSRRNILVLLSGIFLGLAIFTKIPAFTMIPLVAFLFFSNSRKSNNRNYEKSSQRRLALFEFNKKNVKMLGLWFIPVILIPSIWPLYSLAIGQVNLWIEGISYQTGRENENHALIESIDIIFGIDPILLIIGIASIGFSAVVKRDFIFLLWVVPFVVFFASIALVQYFYWILVLPAFCIAAARLIEYISSKITRAATTTVIVNSRIMGRREGLGREGGGYDIYNKDRRSRVNDNNNDVIISNNNRKKTSNGSQRLLLAVLPFTIVSGIGIFGLVSTVLLVTTNVNGQYFNIYSFIVQHLPDRKEDDNSTRTINNATATDIDGTNNSNKVTMVGRHYVRAFYWIPKYIFHKDFDFIDPHFSNTIKTQNILFVLDNPMSTSINRRNELKDVDPGYLWQYLEDNYGTISYRNRIKIFYDITNEIARYGINTLPQDFRYSYSSMTVTPGISRIEIRANY
jgi:hypothetical protein